ncbi:hypothetical protein AOL_s00075g41 [Orbilia oligospora ATCC 24927]|uniref:Uncharacterized protein n=1 Tax=Arthrobotrys oligospora (strain ATCC 24927 / CBS 115.81 / DSM 1491) TaxID=756982 RepID=G1X842_ARTOA|nr:hypothetical protein AOL_s00075g41 [Orbilia oligospora ATCC 24927]EGX50615.1 hypothetical protein AOL_s00075g41 [Orbilia oligospora ATCC 24927]
MKPMGPGWTSTFINPSNVMEVNKLNDFVALSTIVITLAGELFTFAGLDTDDNGNLYSQVNCSNEGEVESRGGKGGSNSKNPLQGMVAFYRSSGKNMTRETLYLAYLVGGKGSWEEDEVMILLCPIVKVQFSVHMINNGGRKSPEKSMAQNRVKVRHARTAFQ